MPIPCAARSPLRSLKPNERFRITGKRTPKVCADDRGSKNLAQAEKEGVDVSEVQGSLCDALRAAAQGSSPLNRHKRWAMPRRRHCPSLVPITGQSNKPRADFRGEGKRHGGARFIPHRAPRGEEGSSPQSEHKRRRAPLQGGAPSLVPITGLEPVRDRSQRILSPMRLPIPPYRLAFASISFLLYFVK